MPVPGKLRALKVECDAHRIYIYLRGGALVSDLLDRYPRLSAATPAQRDHWRPLNSGERLYWPELDFTLVVASLFDPRAPAPH